MIPYGKQCIDQTDIDAVVEILQGDWLTQGPTIEKFEEALAMYCGAKFAVAVSSGTAALHLANLALGVKRGDKVVTTPISFVATSNSILYVGGEPVFCDIQGDTINIDPDAVRKKLRGTDDVKGIIPVHMGGLSADLENLAKIAKENDLWIIEDACHAIGGRWRDSKGKEHRVGDCAFSDLTVFSFHPVKHITTGEGGAITTNDKNLYDQLLELRTHGISKDSEKLEENHGGWYYEMRELGFNYRITDIQAALGIQQLRRSDEWVSRRQALVNVYDEAFSDIPELNMQLHPMDQFPAYHLYIVRAKDREGLYNHLKEKTIFAQVHYIPIHLQPFYRQHFGTGPGDLPEAEAYYREALSLPLFPTMSSEDQQNVIVAVREYYA